MDRNYNRPVRLPYPASAERMWRADGLYEVVVMLGYNDVPRVQGRGSAIFMHIARDDFEPTEGCVALGARDLRRLISRLPRRCEISIRA
jgi:L,D-peptidoglycan transpeptidase YkuD (ErfK/YbiS/YcfS/YnhG family)